MKAVPVVPPQTEAMSPLGDFSPLHPHRPSDAMKLIGYSDSWGSKQRMEDYAAIAEGREAEGPEFSVNPSGSIIYFHKDLVDWLRKHYRPVSEALSHKRKSNLPTGGRGRPRKTPATTDDTPPTEA